MSYVERVIEEVKKKHAGEPEFIQTVTEVFTSLAPVVEKHPEYDMSAYEVYIYNGYGWTNLDPSQDLADIEPAKPDEYGYYTISEVKGEHTVYVVGVVANETLLMVGNILDMVKNIFEMIAGFFAEILAFFGMGA